jgi:hypothetical protein
MDDPQPDEAELRREAQEEVDRRWPNRLEADVGFGVLSLRTFLLGAIPPLIAEWRGQAPGQVIRGRHRRRRALPEPEE